MWQWVESIDVTVGVVVGVAVGRVSRLGAHVGGY